MEYPKKPYFNISYPEYCYYSSRKCTTLLRKLRASQDQEIEDIIPNLNSFSFKDQPVSREDFEQEFSFTLAEIMAVIPTGIDPENIEVEISSDRYRTYEMLALVYWIPINKEQWEKEAADAKEKFDREEMQPYLKALAEYQIWERQDRISKLTAELDRLKN